MTPLHEKTPEITRMILDAATKARQETSNEPEPGLAEPVQWPRTCTVGPGLEGAIACESKIGYVNGAKGWLIYRGYDIFDLCAHSTFEEVSYLLLHGNLPTAAQLRAFNDKLIEFRDLPDTLRMIMSFPIERMNPMGALRLGVNMMRKRLTWRDMGDAQYESEIIYADEDSIAMETMPKGEEHAIYEFDQKKMARPGTADAITDDAQSDDSILHLIAGLSTLTAAIGRLRNNHLPIEPRPDLSHAANFIYMLTGREPTPIEERVMDIALILHADHGMNASTFASMVVASTLSDVYFSIGAGVAALNGPLHGGANEQVLYLLDSIGGKDNVKDWVRAAVAEKKKVMGFGHRVYKAYDPRARILAPLARHMANHDPQIRGLYETAHALETEIVSTLGQKGIFPNVDFYSGLVYKSMGIDPKMYTPIFAVSRVSGWTARVMEYLEHNRIFRPRAIYTGSFDRVYEPIEGRKEDA